MSFQKIPLNPGVYKDDTTSIAGGYFTDADKIRSKNGLPETMDGWELYSSDILLGKCRGLHTWATNSGIKWGMAGTHLQLAAFTDGEVYDITPIVSRTTQTSLTFTTTNGSATVTLNWASHGLVEGQRFNLANPTASSIGGTAVAGTFIVDTNPGTSTLTYSAASTATATAGPTVILCDTLVYLPPGLENGAAGLGYGTGYYSGSVGTGTTYSTPTTGTNYPRTWSLDNFGQNGIAVPRGGSVYEFGSPATSATELVTNGTFTGSATGWTVGTGWAYNSNNVTCTVGSTNPTLSQSITINPAAYYEVEFNISGYTSGQMRVMLGNSTVTNTTLTNATYKLQAYGGGAGGAQTLSFIGTSLGCTMDTVSVTQIINAQVIPNAPTQNTCMVVTGERFIMVGGTIETATGNFNPMHLRWSNINDSQTWTPSSTVLAGFYSLGEGSRIVGMKNGNNEVLVWTDTALYAGTYVPDRRIVYSFRLIGVGCGLIGPNAVAVLGGVAYWMTPAGTTYAYSGGAPIPIKSGISQDVWNNLAFVQQDKIYASPIAEHGDIIWLYPDSRDGNECSRYALLCTTEGGNNPRQQPNMGVWYPGTFDRTAWTDAGVLEYPVAVGTDGYLYYQEKGDSANGAALDWSLSTGDIQIGNGDTLFMVRSFLPDFAALAGGTQMTVNTYKYNQSPAVAHGPFNITTASEKVDLMSDAPVGRMASFEFSGSSSPAQMRAGELMIDIVDTGMAF